MFLSSHSLVCVTTTLFEGSRICKLQRQSLTDVTLMSFLECVLVPLAADLRLLTQSSFCSVPWPWPLLSESSRVILMNLQ